MRESMTATEARSSLPAILDRVSDGDEILITRHGRPVAIILRPDAIRARRIDGVLETAADIRSVVEDSRDETFPVEGSLEKSFAETLIREIRQDRTNR